MLARHGNRKLYGMFTMTQPALYLTLVVTILMWLGGLRSLLRDHDYYMGALLILIPLAGWVSLAFGQ
jgi:hypothetical protein